MAGLAEQGLASEKPLWCKVWDFPLVAMLIAFLLTILTVLGVALGFSMLPWDLNEVAGGGIPTIVAVAALFSLYKLVIRRLGERKYDDLPFPGAIRQLLLGAGGGGLLIAISVGVAALVGVYRVVKWEMGGDFLMILFQAGIMAGFMEELIFRGILFRWIEEFAGSWAALALTSLFFGLAHATNEGATAMSTVAIMFEAGILLGAAYMYARNLWLPIGVHFGWNVTQGFIFDVPVSGHDVHGLVEAQLSGPELLSGGAFGIEASVIALVVCTSGGIWLLVHAIRAGRVMPPRWQRMRSNETVGVDIDADPHALREV